MLDINEGVGWTGCCVVDFIVRLTTQATCRTVCYALTCPAGASNRVTAAGFCRLCNRVTVAGLCRLCSRVCNRVTATGFCRLCNRVTAAGLCRLCNRVTFAGLCRLCSRVCNRVTAAGFYRAVQQSKPRRVLPQTGCCRNTFLLSRSVQVAFAALNQPCSCDSA